MSWVPSLRVRWLLDESMLRMVPSTSLAPDVLVSEGAVPCVEVPDWAFVGGAITPVCAKAFDPVIKRKNSTANPRFMLFISRGQSFTALCRRPAVCPSAAFLRGKLCARPKRLTGLPGGDRHFRGVWKLSGEGDGDGKGVKEVRSLKQGSR